MPDDLIVGNVDFEEDGAVSTKIEVDREIMEGHSTPVEVLTS